jgi:hypothetical protein
LNHCCATQRRGASLLRFFDLFPVNPLRRFPRLGNARRSSSEDLPSKFETALASYFNFVSTTITGSGYKSKTKRHGTCEHAKEISNSHILQIACHHAYHDGTLGKEFIFAKIKAGGNLDQYTRPRINRDKTKEKGGISSAAGDQGSFQETERTGGSAVVAYNITTGRRLMKIRGIGRGDEGGERSILQLEENKRMTDDVLQRGPALLVSGDIVIRVVAVP